mmetsp:Transcript_120490/g.292407  ORF Transcript_120490/g.292407 Transcript_120490/m.292407 type:complete len:526 (+) Transcript_120490:31-1608(+)
MPSPAPRGMARPSMARAFLLHWLYAAVGVWTAEALRTHTPARATGGGAGQPVPGGARPSEPSSALTQDVVPIMDISMEWDTLQPRPRTEFAEARNDTCGALNKSAAFRSPADPLTDDTFTRLPVNGTYDVRFQNLFDKLSSGKSVKMVVLGGSFTAGVDCSEPADGGAITSFRCAWPSRVQAILSELFPQSSISLLNMAHGGTTSSVILGAIALLLRDVEGGIDEIDLIVLDTLVNDAAEFHKWTQHGNLSPGEVVKTSYEALVRVLHEMVPQAALVSLFAGCPACLGMASNQRAVASFYGLPLVDYASLVAQKLDEVPLLWDPPYSHPRWISHQIVADVIAGTWTKVFQGFCTGDRAPQPTFPLETLVAPAQLAQFKTCKSGASEYYAEEPSGRKPTIVHGWRLFEDVPGKPGWISEKPGAVLKFRLDFGEEPKLLFTFLRTYNNIGSAKLEMNGRSAFVQGLDTTHNVSQSHTQWFMASVGISQPTLGEGGLSGFQVAPNSKNVVLTVTAPGAKFKILSVVSC